VLVTVPAVCINVLVATVVDVVCGGAVTVTVHFGTGNLELQNDCAGANNAGSEANNPMMPLHCLAAEVRMQKNTSINISVARHYVVSRAGQLMR
jgi:hypothetical protein